MNYERIAELLKERGQEQLLRFYSELNEEDRRDLLRQIAELDWSAIEGDAPQTGGEIAPVFGLGTDEIAARQSEFFAAGKQAIADGRVAAVLLAGGQGTRLGSEAPKGAYDIGVTKPLYIFECLIRNLQRVCAACGAYVPLLVMTSEKNDGATRDFFAQHGYFGYPEAYVDFFVQGMAPCTDVNGKLLLEGKGRLVLSPNGNGGWYSSLKRAGLLQKEMLRGVEWFNVFSVDNVLQQIADPVFLGATILSGCPSGAKVVRKTEPNEKVGVLCLRGGKPDVVEYYELSPETASARNERGELVYGYGVTLNYLFRAERLEEIAERSIPVHRVKKKVPCLDEEGRYCVPQQENAYKYETLILDMIRLMGSCLPCEVVREKEFAPVKNLTGTDSVETARELLRKNGVEL